MECFENLQFGRIGEKGVGTNLWLCNFLQFHCSVRVCCTLYRVLSTELTRYVHTTKGSVQLLQVHLSKNDFWELGNGVFGIRVILRGEVRVLWIWRNGLGEVGHNHTKNIHVKALAHAWFSKDINIGPCNDIELQNRV